MHKNLPNFTELAEESSPAVVNITSTKTVTNRNSFGGGFGDPRYDEFFERFLVSQDLQFQEKILDLLFQQDLVLLFLRMDIY